MLRTAILGILVVGCSRSSSHSPSPPPRLPPPSTLADASAAVTPAEPVESSPTAPTKVEERRIPEEGQVSVQDARRPSARLIREFVKRLENARDLVDPVEGFMHIVIGPTGASTENPGQINEAKKFCGSEATSKALRDLKEIAVGSFATAYLSCKDLLCTHFPEGEWDSQVQIEFVRKDGRLLLVSYEAILDVPVRDGVEKDFAWARKQRKLLATQKCPAQ